MLIWIVLNAKYYLTADLDCFECRLIDLTAVYRHFVKFLPKNVGLEI